MLAAILVGTIVVFILAYRLYGDFLDRTFSIKKENETPSHTDYDGVDRVPAHRAVLFGHHFSSIAGAGPIVGPIAATLLFGWLPALIWIVVGSIFIGGVHDYTTLVASIRHKARSIAEIANQHMSKLVYKLFLIFIWLTLVYVLIVFADLTAGSFTDNGGVATSSLMFILLALMFGVAVYRMKIPLLLASFIFVPLVFFAIWAGQQMPIKPEMLESLGSPKKVWLLVLIGYCFVASTAPVWILLQPRDYLSSFLLYASILAGFGGILLGGFTVNFDTMYAWNSPDGTVFPILFITIACGACSGFHSIVASGTSSKQLDKETDARTIGYGSMLVEGIIAIIAIVTVITVARGDLAGLSPNKIYGDGIGRFLAVFGVPAKLGASFGLLALSTFILTTLDTATRLGRYIFEELFSIKSQKTRFFSTLVTLALPAYIVMQTLKDANGNVIPAWKAVWPLFGATNQLLAGLALLIVAVWLKRSGRKTWFVVVPMIFMNVTTLYALVLLILKYKASLLGILASLLLVLAVIVIFEGVRVFLKSKGGEGSIDGERKVATATENAV